MVKICLWHATKARSGKWISQDEGNERCDAVRHVFAVGLLHRGSLRRDRHNPTQKSRSSPFSLEAVTRCVEMPSQPKCRAPRLVKKRPSNLGCGQGARRTDIHHSSYCSRLADLQIREFAIKTTTRSDAHTLNLE